MPKWRGNLNILTSNLNFLIKSAWLLMILGYLTSFNRSIFYNSVIIPGLFFPPNFKIWTIVTHMFVEVHIWTLCCNLVIIFLYHQLLGPLWGLVEMHKFMLLNTVVSAIGAAAFYITYHMLTDQLDFIFTISIYGFSANIAGFCVAVKQIMPDQVLFTCHGLKLQNKHIPSLLFIFVSIAYIFHVVQFTFPVLYFFGLVSSWTYLRFYQKHSNHNYGDAADSFSFASFFPEPIQPLVAIPANKIHSFNMYVGICKRPTKPNLVSLSNLESSNPLNFEISISGPKNGNLPSKGKSSSTSTIINFPQQQQDILSQQQQQQNQHKLQQQQQYLRSEDDSSIKGNINIKEALSKNLITFKVVENAN